ncbi:MAG: hypothetical protein ABFS21_11680, partial [Actinomycetota bacterium]
MAPLLETHARPCTGYRIPGTGYLAVDRPTRQEQAQAILKRKARRLASQILGHRATTAAEFNRAFTLERVDIVSEIADAETLLSLGTNRVGPRDGLYILESEGRYRVYVQERGIPQRERFDLPFDAARDAVIDELVMLNGIPFSV